MKKDAIISECGLYRYSLSRIWEENKPLLGFIMLNPSTADAENDDATIRSLIRIVTALKYGGFYVGNLLPIRCTDPKLLPKKHVDKLILDLNMKNIVNINKNVDKLVFSWGNNYSELINYAALKVKDAYKKDAYQLGDRTKIGNPRHPLYLKTNTPLQKFII